MNNTAFEALADEQRRRLLVSLLEEDQRTVSAVVSGAIEEETATRNASKQVAMRHNHLPKLADHGFVQWSRGTGEIIQGPQFDQIRPLLEFVSDHTGR